MKFRSVEFHELVVRGLDLWVDDNVKDRAEILVGRPAINAFGYSADGVLVAARKLAAIWDLDALDPEPEPTTSMARVNRLMQAELDDDGDEYDGLQCATPLPCSFDVTAQAERKAAV
ncbi:hypothetical protein H310_15408 [Aphanomyces invadans]|uniref:Uncharacterized protein n=1 Tax=Aphanomyces invadans TaxID=157072 RepID=A0A024T7G8_9STRA|nr:hypothetical protein H310_15408 [Aphanomyces invadans]ETV89763.1 hypothetical protein H310_15408 [Aphanomyces invadans]|eukprot:XP_008881605.1 hypothetical protein H310_15408 [Aphanomyces invadans]